MLSVDPSSDTTGSWAPGTKLAFRFFFVFFLFLIIPIPGFFLSWLAGHIVHISYTPPGEGTGSGDTTYHYLVLLGSTVISAVACLVWSVADYRRSHYQVFYQWYSIYARYYLAIVLLGYGTQKLIQGQFPPLMPGQLLDTYGQSSPMGLLWKFMQYSRAYNIFTGLAEIIPALLLLFRPTRLLGALIATAVMANIVALNFCYDVPVKIYSTELLLMALFIAAGGAPRLIGFFILNKPIDAEVQIPYFESGKMRYAGLAVKLLFISLALIITGVNLQESDTMIKSLSADGPLSGIYNVETFVIGHDTLPPLVTDTIRWSKFAMSIQSRAGIRYMNETKKAFTIKTDTVQQTIAFTPKGETTVTSIMHYSKTDSAHLLLQGPFAGDSLLVSMKKIDSQKSRLLSRGFHWVNEYPMNY